MNVRNVRQLKVLIFTLIAIVTLGIGYAGITAINLVINGDATASVNDQNFKVKFLSEKNVTPTITGEGNTVSVKDDTTAEFSVSTLTGLGDSEVATFRVKNESKGIGVDISLKVTNSNSDYFKVTEHVADTQLQAGDETTVTVTVEMIKTPIDDDVSTSLTAKLVANAIDDEAATGSSPATKVAGEPDSFATDSWATIQKAVQNNNTSLYNIGDTKSVTINGNNYTVRIANKTTGEHCGDNDIAYSQTACGFVVEFAEIVEKRAMNSENTNIGGWPGSELYAYLQESFYNELPSDLKAVIVPTRVISGYGNNGTDSSNFITIDNLYLLSGVEVFGDGYADNSASTTTQLDYYQGMVADKDTPGGGKGYSRTYKGYNGSNGERDNWWLRAARFNNSISFRIVYVGTLGDSTGALSSVGVSPAFRIA